MDLEGMEIPVAGSPAQGSWLVERTSRTRIRRLAEDEMVDHFFLMHIGEREVRVIFEALYRNHDGTMVNEVWGQMVPEF